jgi:hypothetical protein
MTSAPKLKPIAFILGTPRSGTTLLRVMLAGHPKLFSPPEMVLAPFETMAERKAHMEVRFWEKTGLRRALMDLLKCDVAEAKAAEAKLDDRTIPEVYAHLQELIGDRMLVDKCPHLGTGMSLLERLTRWVPDARYLWIVRHPGSVTRSLENMPMAEVMLTNYAGGASEVWWATNKVYRDFLARIPPERWAMVRYEELVSNPRPVMERACAALGVPFHEATLDPYEGDRMREGPPGARAIGDPNLASRGKIDPELATSWLANFDPASVGAETHALAKELGYDLSALPPPAIARVTDAMTALWDTARELERKIKLPMDIDAVEGRRFLLRMISASIDVFVEQGDVDHPSFHHAEGPSRKMFADCPDADYLRAPIRLGPGRVYQIKGRVPKGTLYSGIVLYGKGGRVLERMHDAQFQLDDEGRFTVSISTEPQPGAWLKGQGDETSVIVRQYFRDRNKEAPLELSIALTSEAPKPPAPLDAQTLATRVELAKRMLNSVFERTLNGYKMASNMAFMRFVELGGENLFPTPDNRYHVAWYRFGHDQVMFVRGKMPKARYIGVSLCNAWMESLDYLHHRVNLNHTQIQLAPDGSYELCLAHRDPGHPNWLDTAGHHAGYILLRELLPEGEAQPPTIEVLYEKEYRAKRAGKE